MKKIGIIYLFLIFISCSRSTFSAGTYETYAENAVLMVGNTLQLKADKTFDLKHWSDDISGNKKGMGKYEIKGNQLVLNFEDYPNQESGIHQKELSFGSTQDGYTYQFKVVDKNKKPLLGVNITCYNAENQLISGGTTNVSGTLSMVLSQKKHPHKISLSYLGFEEMEIDLSENPASKVFEVNLAETTRYYKEGEQKTYEFKARKGGLLTLKENGRKLVLKLEE